MTDISLYVPSLRGGGAERVMVTLANGFADAGYTTDLVVANATGPYRSEVAPSVRVVDLGADRVASSLPALVRYLRRVKPRSMLSAVTHANVIAVLACMIARATTRLVVTEHNTLSETRKRPNGLNGKLVQLLMRWAYRRVGAIVAVSKGVADDLATTLSFSQSEIKIVYNPVVTAKLLERSQAAFYHPWLVEGASPVILGVGRLTEQKDFANLVNAFAKVRATKDCRLVILGEGELKGELEAQCELLGIREDVLFPGFAENPFVWMRRSAVFVLSSAWEGLPTVLIEAMACGAKVVSTDCPSGPSEILEGGKWGGLVPVGDSAALGIAISDALATPADERAFDRAAYFGVEQAIKGYVALLFK